MKQINFKIRKEICKKHGLDYKTTRIYEYATGNNRYWSKMDKDYNYIPSNFFLSSEKISRLD